MKKLVVLVLFSISLNGFGQTVTFDYDIAGNQIKRVYNATGSRLAQENSKEYKDIVSTDLQKFYPEDVISYYPNPVKDELFLQWEVVNDNKVTGIDLYSLNGQIVKKMSLINENNAVISFQELTTGTYLVNLNYTNGEQKLITIIKN